MVNNILMLNGVQYIYGWHWLEREFFGKLRDFLQGFLSCIQANWCSSNLWSVSPFICLADVRSITFQNIQLKPFESWAISLHGLCATDLLKNLCGIEHACADRCSALLLLLAGRTILQMYQTASSDQANLWYYRKKQCFALHNPINFVPDSLR
jgi:hypothetical protein